MDTQALAKEINDLLGVETRSLMEHLHEATPHVDAGTYRIWQQVRNMAHRDTDHAARLSAILSRLDLPERPTPFPQSVGDFHFMTIDRLIPLLIADKQKQVAAYSRAIAHAFGDAEVTSELESLRADNDAELKQLQAIEVSLRQRRGSVSATSGDITAAAGAVVAAKALAKAKAARAG